MRIRINDDIKNRERKNKRKITMDTYRDFSKNTSIHGLKYTANREIIFIEKIFWVIVVLLGFLAAVYMTSLFWQRYTSNPTKTTILTNYAPTATIPFPAVTICNFDWIVSRKVDQFASKLDLGQDVEIEIVKKVLFQTIGFTTSTNIVYNESELALVQKIFEMNDAANLVTTVRKISQNCDELFLSCQWNKQLTQCSKLFVQSITNDGICCTFNHIPPNSKEKPIRTQISGIGTGLKLVLKPELQPSTYYDAHYAPGVKVNINGPYIQPGHESISKLISVGRMMLLQLMGTRVLCSADVKMLAVAHRKCVYPSEYTLRYFSRYLHTNCVYECEALQHYKACGCVPFYYHFTDKPVCNVTRLPCIQRFKRGEWVVGAENCENCPASCEDIFYTVISSSTSLNYNETKNTLFYRHGVNVSEDKIVLNVYFWNNRQTVLLRDTITSTVYLLSSFGGVYGLFLGCSFITVIEIVYYFVVRPMVNLSSFSGPDNDRKKSDGKSSYVHNSSFARDAPGPNAGLPPNKYLN